tara:strand:- start:17 stop:277 length:261 start_codon:yes stop_codon:yes gene_type:complete
MSSSPKSSDDKPVVPDSSESQASSSDAPAQEQTQLNLLEVPITDEHAALNVIVGFLGVAQRRGAFAINESAKIFECVKMFQKTDQQ